VSQKITRTDVVRLVAYVTQVQPAQQVDEYTPDAWFDILCDMSATFDQLRAATAEVAKRERWIYPSAIREELKTILRAANPEPPALAIGQIRAWEECPDRLERIARGKARVQVVLDAVAAKKVAEDPQEANISESLRRAREVAREYKRARVRPAAPSTRPGDPNKLGRAGAELLTQISNARRSHAE
jgi:hypothetical protein